MHKIITKIIEPTKTITQSMKKQFVTWFIRFCPCKNRDEVLLTLGCLNVNFLNPWVIFVKVLWSRYCRIQCKKMQILTSPSQISTTFLVPIFGHFELKKDPLQRFLDFFWHLQLRETRVLYGTEYKCSKFYSNFEF